MAIQTILPYDYFHQWRSKTNLTAQILGDISAVNVDPADKDTFVEAVNKIISNIGPLTSLTTTSKSTLVGAINELDGELGTLSTLTTTAKSTLVGAINELDGELGVLSSLTTTAKSTLVGAINELDGELGTLSTLTTTAKSTLVGAINELDGELGTLSSLNTTAKSTLVSAINEIFDSLLIGNATFTIDAEAVDVIKVSVQLKTRSGSNLAIRAGVFAYLSDNSDGSTLIATATSGGWEIDTNGILINSETNKSAQFICNASGVFDINITEAGTKTVYLVIVLPLGNIKISDAITFAA